MAWPLASSIGSWVAGGLAASIGTIITRAMAALGIGYVTYTFAMPEFVSLISTQFVGLPPEVRGVIAMTKVDVAITIILSAVAARTTMRMIWRRL